MVEVNAHQEATVPCLQDGAHDTIGNDGDNVVQSINRIAMILSKFINWFLFTI
jgi:hypothetical protein